MINGRSIEQTRAEDDTAPYSISNDGIRIYTGWSPYDDVTMQQNMSDPEFIERQQSQYAGFGVGASDKSELGRTRKYTVADINNAYRAEKERQNRPPVIPTVYNQGTDNVIPGQYASLQHYSPTPNGTAQTTMQQLTAQPKTPGLFQPVQTNQRPDRSTEILDSLRSVLGNDPEQLAYALYALQR